MVTFLHRALQQYKDMCSQGSLWLLGSCPYVAKEASEAWRGVDGLPGLPGLPASPTPPDVCWQTGNICFPRPSTQPRWCADMTSTWLDRGCHTGIFHLVYEACKLFTYTCKCISTTLELCFPLYYHVEAQCTKGKMFSKDEVTCSRARWLCRSTGLCALRTWAGHHPPQVCQLITSPLASCEEKDKHRMTSLTCRI